ncbi:hypothetical protein KUTeg_010279, partial [Tegillarca granosa]
MRYLVINADDFGYSKERNEGIVECFKQKIITSTSLLVNGIAVSDAARLSLQHEIPTGKEVQCQIDRFKDLMGYTPVHTDGHQHIHILPEICSIFASVLKENGILATRVPAEILHDDHIWRSKEQSIFMSRVVQDAKSARSVFNQAAISNTEIVNKPITCELMVHPGFLTGEVGGCGNGPDDFSQSVEREHEMSILANQNILQFYQQT